MMSKMQPLRKWEQFFLGNPTAEEYAASFSESGANGRAGMNWKNVGGINFRKVWKGLKKAVGINVGVEKKSEL